MQNFLLMKPSIQAEELSRQFGYSETLFLEQDFVIIQGENRKKVFSEIHQAKAKGKIAIYRASSEEMLRFVLEKTPVTIVMGMETIHKSDSLHFVRGGLDQVLCKIAADRDKIIGFSFNDIIESKSVGEAIGSKNREKLIARMMANIILCKKYKVKTLFSGFFPNLKLMKSAHDLEAFRQVLEQNDRNIYK